MHANFDYNPVPFVYSHIDVFLQQTVSEVVSVEFSGYLKKAFQSRARPVGFVNIRYKDKSGIQQEQKVVLKHTRGARQAFDAMKDVYVKLERDGLQYKMPKPLLYDKDNDVFFIEYFDGVGLKYYTANRIWLHCGTHIRTIFFQIGRWLAAYHRVMELDEEIALSKYVDQVAHQLQCGLWFTVGESQHIAARLHSLQANWGDLTLRLTRPHNDFALRNIIVTRPSDFAIIDWDAMVTGCGPDKAPIWSDLCCFYLNTQSFVRFEPFVSRRRIACLSESFIDGYFNRGGEAGMQTLRDMLWLFALVRYMGIDSDRPLVQIYSGRVSGRYIEHLRKALLSGTSDITQRA